MCSYSKPISNLIELANSENVESLWELVKCSRCEGFEPGPVFMCSHGHVTCRHCQVCSEGLCPAFITQDDGLSGPGLCAHPLTVRPSKLYDGIFNASRFWCNYADKGCEETVLGEYYTLHMATCPFRSDAVGMGKVSSRVIKMFHVVKRVSPEYVEAQKKQPSISWSPKYHHLL